MEQRPGLEQGALGPGAPLHQLSPTSASTQDRRCPVEHGAGGSEHHWDAGGVLHNRAHLRVPASSSGDLEFLYVGGRLLLIRKRISR